MRAKCTRNNRRNRQSGGGAGGGWGFAPEAAGTLINNPLSYKDIGNCREAVRPGMIANGYDAFRVHGGLPGMKGGSRSRKHKKQTRTHKKQTRTHKKQTRTHKKQQKNKRSSRSRKNKVQHGGRYGFDPQMAPLLGGTPSTSGYAPVSSIPCEASRSVIPDSGASGVLNSRASYLWDSPATGKQAGGGSGNPISGAPFIEVPTAHYSDNTAAPIRSAAGTNIMVHTPYNYSQMNQACVKTGGGKKSKTARKSKGRKNKNKH